MKCKIKVSAFLCFVLGSSLGAGVKGQTATGTVVVIGWSQNKIVGAADSRSSDKIGNYRDDICKILALDNRSIFTASGIVMHSISGQRLWDAFQQASDSFREARKTINPHFLKIAAAHFGDRMVDSINQSLKVDPSGSTEYLEDNMRFLSGVFIGFENSSTAMYQVEIIFDPSVQQAKQIFDVERQWPTLHFGALGRSAIVNEVLIGKTDFARAEQNKWNASVKHISLEDRDVRWAIHLVELTVAHYPKKADIGGPVDAVEITSKGIRWVNRKPECNP